MGLSSLTLDNMVDTILFDANFSDIKARLQCSTLELTAHETNPAKMIKIVIVDWLNPHNQHLLIRSIDGVVFELSNSVLYYTQSARSIKDAIRY